ncbi:MAG: DUF2169 domain-containing protein [Polyangiaceae bacterium]
MTTLPLPSLAVTALSPVVTGASLCRLAGLLWATVIVKATFELVHGAAARLIAPEPLVDADRAAAPGQSLLRARETAPHLPNAGVLLSGHACAPDGRAVSSMSVRLGLSRERPVLDKTLHVFGARGVNNPAAVAPFQKMPLVYERAFGGPGTPENPVGVGGPASAVFPNIVDPKDPRKVAGFGPLSPHWASRRALLRGVDPAVLDGPMWDVPAGFDWRFFQAAPQDQQIERLHGDEWIVLDGMDAARPRVQSRLPEVTARARRRAVDGRGAVSEEGVELRADMLVIDADRGVASLVWRGRFAVDSMESLARVTVLVGLEQPGKPVAWPAPPQAPMAAAAATMAAAGSTMAAAAATMETQEVNLSALLGAKVPFAADRESHVPAPPSAPRAPAKEPPRGLDTGTTTVDIQAILKGATPFAEPADHTPALPFESAEPGRPSLASLPTPAAQRAPRMDTATADIDVAQILRNATPYAAPPEATPHVAAPVAIPPVAIPLGAALVAIPPVATPLVAAPAIAPSLIAPSLIAPSLIATPAIATPAVAPVDLQPPPHPTPPLASAEAGRARARVLEKLANKAPLDGDNLSFANLSGLDLSGCSLARCDLRGAKLRGTKLRGADLSRAVLDEADLRGAQLDEADLTDASVANADLEQASLARATAVRANLRDARLHRADLRGATLADARLEGATMVGVQASGADLTNARLDGADLTDARLSGIVARGAVLANATLDGADLRRADLERANLHACSTRRARLAGANLKNTVDEPPQ